MNNSLTGSTALVTGGNSGIGRATALAFARRGAHVMLSGRDAGRGEKVVAEIHAQGGTADFVKSDLSDEASARQLAADHRGGHHRTGVLLADQDGRRAAAGRCRSATRSATC